MQGADDLLAEILEHTIQRKEKRGDLGWRQGISIGQHSSDTYVLWRSISVRTDYATDHSFLLAQLNLHSKTIRDCNGQIRDASLDLDPG